MGLQEIARYASELWPYALPVVGAIGAVVVLSRLDRHYVDTKVLGRPERPGIEDCPTSRDYAQRSEH